MIARPLALLQALAVSVAFASAATSPATAAEAAFSDAQRGQIQAIIKDYLVKNPEVLQEAIAELEHRQQDAQKTAQSDALKSESSALLTSPHGSEVGNPSGNVTLVEFFDYNCGFCKKALSDIRTLEKSDPKLRIVLKDFPVLGPDSLEASKVALAVKQQISGDKLFDYHTRLLNTHGRVNGDKAVSLARDMGLDMARLQRDMAGPDVKAALQENAALGEKLGLTGTPTFIVGDEVISGAVGLDPLRQAIAGVRQCGHATC